MMNPADQPQIMDMLRKYGPRGSDIALVQLASSLGIRETRVVEAAHGLTEEEVLHGVRFPDAIANGSYRVDVHAPEGGGFLFKHLDGRTLFAHGNGCQEGRWRDMTPIRRRTAERERHRDLRHVTWQEAESKEPRESS